MEDSVMSSFICDKCGTEIIDSPDGYLTECEHWPKERLKPLGPQYTTMIDLTEWHTRPKNPKCGQVDFCPEVKRMLAPLLEKE
jgi:hypothetical protein